MKIRKIFSKFVRFSDKEAHVIVLDFRICFNFSINTKTIKHLYDKRPAREFDLILRYINQIISNPDYLYENKKEKRGDYVFVKNIRYEKYLCSFEIIEEKYQIVTCFRVDDKYLENYILLWSRKDDIPSS